MLVVDDHRAFAEAIGLTINGQPDMECVGVATSAEEALLELDRKLPDVILLDLGLPGKSGIEALVEIKRRQPAMRVLLISGAVSPEALVEAANEGADGYVHKEASLDAVIIALRKSDDTVVADDRTLTTLSRAALPTPPDEFGLTARELEVLVLLADGVATKLIARQLGITLNTCRGYVRSILQKLDAHSQLSAVVKAAQFGLLPRLRA
ncbi:MAG TPA: response regulator transcription factor [Mycobacteriales bacterium]|nr:response regulator transcription factor [Mycobacteriales bacterium]